MTITGASAWAHCGQGSSADSVGCNGIALPGLTRCLSHAEPGDRTAFFSSLAPGDDIDLRGTTFTPDLLSELKTALTDPGIGNCRLGKAQFDSATFTGDAVFESATFTGSAVFRSATFSGGAWFGSVSFTGDAWFESATFTEASWFESATFTGDAWFESATFTGSAVFRSATFSGDAYFESVVFGGGAVFAAATFNKEATFDSATFEGAQRIGPLSCRQCVSFSQARFTGQQIVVEAACSRLRLDGATFVGTVSVRARYADVSLSGAVLGGKMALQAHPVPFASTDRRPVEESTLASSGTARVRLVRVDAVDASALVLGDVDLSDCAFTGAFHLDQIRLGSGCTFRQPPPGWHRHGPVPGRWSRRKTLAEEHHRRALTAGPAGMGWERGPDHPDQLLTPDHGDLTEIYRHLRKAFEDSGDEPDAADFYYGEMEMRRHDTARTRAERGLLWLYWLVSGYGLRASRALACLGVAMAATVLLLLAVGLPDADPVPQTTGTNQAGHLRLATATASPKLTLPLGQRYTRTRADKATLVVINSVIFRSSGQNLTLPGTVVEMLSRISEPVLLTLAALAVRGRIKR